MAVVALGDRRIPLRISTAAGVITYRFAVDVPGTDTRAPVRVELSTRSRPWRPKVFASVPVCLRHRYEDGSLCMWWERHPNERRWMMSDGLAPLVHYIEAHLHQEACCRAGERWPGEEAPGSHGRKRACATCRGVGP
jgi:hypothetical protein